MPSIIRKPNFSIWVEGYPLSSQATRQTLERYKSIIKDTTSKIVPYPIKSRRIDIEIFFQAKNTLRADVDNIIKPILDALKGVVYFDDSQVRSVKVTAIPSIEEGAYGTYGWTNIETWKRLTNTPPKEYLINIFEGFSFDTSGV